MSELKSTPGPWMVLPSNEQDEFVVLTANGHRIDLARTYGYPGIPREANAHLIAAAPELYAALGLLLADIKDYEAWQRPCHAVDVAVAAMAKARGEPS